MFGQLFRAACRGEYSDNFSKNHMLGWILGQLFKESYARVDIWTTFQRTTQKWIFGQLF